MHTLQKPYLCSPQITRGWWAVHTLHQFVRRMPAIHEQWGAVRIKRSADKKKQG